MIIGTRSRTPAGSLLRVGRSRPSAAVGERCEMCAEPVGPDHSHVVNLDSRALMCSCRPCYLLFSDQRAALRYRAVPERFLRFEGPGVDERTWDESRVPVGLAFLFRNSVQGRSVAFYPGPAGATESELPPETWEKLVAADPALGTLLPDVEALLLRRPTAGAEAEGSCYLVPIDACYELVGRLRTLWRGFDGGREAHEAIDAFFARVAERGRPAATETPS